MFDIDFSRLFNLFTYDPSSPMIFSSGIFLFLFLAFAAVYACLSRKDTMRIAFVTLFSYYFYYKSSGIYFLLLGLVTVSDFYLARAIYQCCCLSTEESRERGRKAGKALVAFSVIIDLLLLGYFKYTNFLGSIFVSGWKDLDIFLPVGISFFTFQSLSYTIDVYRGKIQPLDRLLDYAFYVSFFPQLVAGPIVRACDFIPQIRRPLMVTNEMFGKGIFFIIAGLFKKAVISDYISLNFVDRVFDSPLLYSGVENLLASYGYALQIYCDFSGYSDMAIGIALILGFEFPMNFNNPFRSRSVTEFWRRWHISLSSWLKDYVYISLGGNRKGKLRQYLNLLITMFLGGLWHGASVKFVIWGCIHGLLLCLDKIWNSICPKYSPLQFIAKKRRKTEDDDDEDEEPSPLFKHTFSFLSLIITFHLVLFTWVIFRAQSFQSAWDMTTQVFTNFKPQVFSQWVASYWGVGLLMIIGYLLHFMPQSITNFTRKVVVKSPLILQVVYVLVVVYIVIQVKSSDVQPFIYFQF